MIPTSTVAHFRTGIGNFVLITPALRALAKMDESGQVDIFTDANWIDPRKEGLIDLWERLPYVQNVYAFGIDKFEKPYKTYFWTNWTSGGDALAAFKEKKPYQISAWDQRQVHESDYYFDIVKKHYGFDGWKPTQLIVPAPDPILDDGRIKIVLCNGGFGDIKVFKNWVGFKELAHHIKALYGDTVAIVKVGYKDELSDVTEFDYDFVGKLSITQTAKVIEQAALMITTDTGNMHIADALGTPIVTLWGGSSVEKNRPIMSQHKIVTMGLHCQPCQQDTGYYSCPDIKCITGITVGEIMFIVRNFFNKGIL